MARDGSGTYARPVSDYVYDTVISETDVNTEMDDIAAALTASIAKDGQTVPTANLPMGTYRHTGVGNASARTDYAAAGQVQDGSFVWCGTAGGTKNALTLTPSPAITAYAAGQRFRFKAGATASDDAVTIAVSGLTTKAGEINDTALSASLVIDANKYYEALYDGTAFQLSRLSAIPLSDSADARTALGLGTAATKNTGTSGDVVPLLNATINMGDNVLQRPEIKDPAETVQAVSSTAGSLTVDYSAGQVATITLTEDITAFDVSNWPATGKAGGLTIEITQHASAAKTIDWGNVDFGDGGEPDLSVVGSVHIVEIFTRDAGTTEYGVLAFSKTV